MTEQGQPTQESKLPTEYLSPFECKFVRYWVSTAALCAGAMGSAIDRWEQQNKPHRLDHRAHRDLHQIRSVLRSIRSIHEQSLAAQTTENKEVRE